MCIMYTFNCVTGRRATNYRLQFKLKMSDLLLVTKVPELCNLVITSMIVLMFCCVYAVSIFLSYNKDIGLSNLSKSYRRFSFFFFFF